MKFFLLVAGLVFLMILVIRHHPVESQADPLCVVVQGFVADAGRKPMVVFACDNEGPTFRFVSDAFYKRFMDSTEPPVLRKSEIR